MKNWVPLPWVQFAPTLGWRPRYIQLIWRTLLQVPQKTIFKQFKSNFKGVFDLILKKLSQNENLDTISLQLSWPTLLLRILPGEGRPSNLQLALHHLVCNFWSILMFCYVCLFGVWFCKLCVLFYHCALIVNFTIPNTQATPQKSVTSTPTVCWRYTEISFKRHRLKPFEEIKKYFHTLVKKIFIFLHTNLQAKILLNKMRSLIFPTRRQKVFTFFYGHYHSKFFSTTTSDTAIFMRAWLENYTCYLPSTCCQSRLLRLLMTCQRRIWLDLGKVRDWCHM